MYSLEKNVYCFNSDVAKGEKQAWNSTNLVRIPGHIILLLEYL